MHNHERTFYVPNIYFIFQMKLIPFETKNCICIKILRYIFQRIYFLNHTTLLMLKIQFRKTKLIFTLLQNLEKKLYYKI